MEQAATTHSCGHCLVHSKNLLRNIFLLAQLLILIFWPPSQGRTQGGATGVLAAWLHDSPQYKQYYSVMRGHPLSLHFNRHFPGEPGLAGVY